MRVNDVEMLIKVVQCTKLKQGQEDLFFKVITDSKERFPFKVPRKGGFYSVISQKKNGFFTRSRCVYTEDFMSLHIQKLLAISQEGAVRRS